MQKILFIIFMLYTRVPREWSVWMDSKKQKIHEAAEKERERKRREDESR